MADEKTIEIRKQFARHCWKHQNFFQRMRWRFSYKLWEKDYLKSVELQELRKEKSELTDKVENLEQAKEILHAVVHQGNREGVEKCTIEWAEQFLKGDGKMKENEIELTNKCNRLQVENDILNLRLKNYEENVVRIITNFWCWYVSGNHKRDLSAKEEGEKYANDFFHDLIQEADEVKEQLCH